MIHVLLTSSRTWDDAGYIWRTLDALLAEHGSLTLTHGHCPTGGDAIGDAWAIAQQRAGAAVHVDRHPADWSTYGRAAGFRRNAEMVAEVASKPRRVCLAFIRDNSKGASHCAKLARRAGIDVQGHAYE